MSDSSNSGAFFTGFLIGGLVGAAAALLMTPESGENMRIQLKERGVGLKSQLDDLTADAQERAEKLATQVQEQGKAVVEEQLDQMDQEEEEETTT